LRLLFLILGACAAQLKIKGGPLWRRVKPYGACAGRKHSEVTKDKISSKLSKYPLGVGIYDLDNNLIAQFRAQAPT